MALSTTSSSTAAPSRVNAHRRRGFLALLGGLALATALGTGLFDTGHSVTTTQDDSSHQHTSPAASSATRAAFHDEMRRLWEDHIAIAVELLQAAKAGDDAAFAKAHTAWYANGDDVADFLAAANPRFWPQDQMRAAMRGHLDQTLAEAGHELNGQYAASVADYDEIHHHILAMADVLSTGIIHAFPQRFH